MSDHYHDGPYVGDGGVWAPSDTVGLRMMSYAETAAKLNEHDAEIARLREALTLAANRLDRSALNVGHGSRAWYEAGEWAEEARAALLPADGGAGVPVHTQADPIPVLAPKDSVDE